MTDSLWRDACKHGELPRQRGLAMWTDNLHANIGQFITSAKEDLTIFAPYIRVDPLVSLLQHAKAKQVSVVTTWTTRDILNGFSELAVFDYLQSVNAHLFLLPRLHMKLFLADYQRAVLSTANITSSGLGLQTPCNIEAAAMIGNIAPSEQLWFARLISQSMLVQASFVSALRRHIASQQDRVLPCPIIELDASCYRANQQFLISSLPLIESPHTLLRAMEQIASGKVLPAGYLAAVCHDCVLYDLDLHSSTEENNRKLRRSFFEHAFVRALGRFVEATGRRYFGEVKAWVQKTCSDVPVPRRKDLAGHVRTLFDWMVALGNGAYVVRVPRHSECLMGTAVDGMAV